MSNIKDTTQPRIIDQVVQQCWINDYTQDTGVVYELDVTDQVLAMGREAALLLKDDRDNTDALVPQEMIVRLVPDEPLCFRVEVEDAIRAYFAEEIDTRVRNRR